MFRFRIGRLMALVVLVGLGIEGFLIVQDRRVGQARRQAFQGLGFYAPARTFKESELVAALDDPELRDAAVWALEQINSTSPALVVALAERLETETGESRHENRWDPRQIDPVRVLKRIQPPAQVIIPLLTKASSSTDPWIRSQANEVLCEVAGRPGPPPPALAQLLLPALEDESPRTRIRAAEVLALLDADSRGRAVAMLADRLRDGDTASRLSDLYLIGRLGPVAGDAVPSVVAAMTSPHARRQIFFFLNGYLPKQGDQYSFEFDAILDSPERSQSPSTLCTLGGAVLRRIGPEAERQAVVLLSGMLADGDERLRLRVVEALGELGERASASVPTLLDLAEREPSSQPENGEDPVVRRLMAVKKVCAAADPRFVDTLIRMTKSDDSTKRWAAALLMQQIEPPAPSVESVLIGLLKDETQSVRCQAATTLGRLDGPGREAAILALLDALRDEDQWCRAFVARALAEARADADRVIPTVLPMLRSEQPNLRRFAAEILGRFGPAAGAAVPTLREARRDANEFVRDEAEKALKAIAPSGTSSPD